MLQDKYKVEDLPDNWHYNGRYYINDDCETKYEHPFLEKFIVAYLDERNAEINEYNNEIDKQHVADKEKYDHAI